MILQNAITYYDYIRPRMCCSRILSAGIQTAGDLTIAALTNAANKRMNEQTNATNYQIAQDTNEMNYQIHQEDNAFNAEQAQIAREWDSPAEQRKRLLEAGYNPLMIGDLSGGGITASSEPSPNMQAATMNPNHFEMPNIDFLGRLVESIGLDKQEAEARLINAQADKQNLDNDFDATTFADRATMVQARSRYEWDSMLEFANSKAFRQGSQKFKSEMWDFFRKRFEQIKRDSDQVFVQRAAQFSWWKEVTAQQRKEFPSRLKELAARVRNIDANTALQYAQKKLAEKQGDQVAAQTQTINELRPEQVKLIKAQIFHNGVVDALASLHVPQGQRQMFADALLSYGQGSIDKMFDALDKISYNGDATNWFSAMQKFIGADKFDDLFARSQGIVDSGIDWLTGNVSNIAQSTLDFMDSFLGSSDDIGSIPLDAVY